MRVAKSFLGRDGLGAELRVSCDKELNSHLEPDISYALCFAATFTATLCLPGRLDVKVDNLL